MSWEYEEGFDEEMDDAARECCGEDDLEDQDDGNWICGVGGPDC